MDDSAAAISSSRLTLFFGGAFAFPLEVRLRLEVIPEDSSSLSTFTLPLACLDLLEVALDALGIGIAAGLAGEEARGMSSSLLSDASPAIRFRRNERAGVCVPLICDLKKLLVSRLQQTRW